VLQSGYTVEDGDSDKSPFTPTTPGGSAILEPDVVHPEPPSVKNGKTSAEGQDGNMRPKFVLVYVILVLISTLLHRKLLSPPPPQTSFLFCMDQWGQSFLLNFFHLFALFLISSSIWGVIVLDHPISLYPSNFNYDVLFCVLLLSILLHDQSVVVIYFLTINKV
jgi:hypothetical protein